MVCSALFSGLWFIYMDFLAILFFDRQTNFQPFRKMYRSLVGYLLEFEFGPNSTLKASSITEDPLIYRGRTRDAFLGREFPEHVSPLPLREGFTLVGTRQCLPRLVALAREIGALMGRGGVEVPQSRLDPFKLVHENRSKQECHPGRSAPQVLRG